MDENNQTARERRALEEANRRLREANIALEKRLRTQTRELMEARAEALAAKQAKSAFLAGMSHELRTPLNAVIGFSEMLGSGVFGPLGDPHYGDYAAIILQSGRHLLDLINDILDCSALDAGLLDLYPEAVDLGALIGEAAQKIDPIAKKGGVLLHADPGADLPSLWADKRRMLQILVNLLSNAVKFTPRGGVVGVSAGTGPSGVTVRIVDTGIGMAADEIPKALTRFSQLDNSLSRKYEGTGLGLSLARSLMELHGGRLAIESTPGVGTIVTLDFPLERTYAASQVA